MIAQLKGILTYKSYKNIIVDVNGIGYLVYVPLSTFYKLPEINKIVKLNIYTYIKDGTIDLYGFFTNEEKDIFQLLIAISGIGPKLAINILSGISPEELKKTINSNNSNRLRSIPGVGKKGSERIILELREKMDSFILADFPENKVFDDKKKDILSALLNLGYDINSAKAALGKIESEVGGQDLPLEDLLKMTLKVLAR